MRIKTLGKTALAASFLAITAFQFHGVLVKTAMGGGPLTAPFTNPITPTPEEENPLSSPEQTDNNTPPTPPLTAPEQNEDPEETSTPTATPTEEPMPVPAPATTNNSGSSGASNNGGGGNSGSGSSNGGSGSSVCTNEAPKSGPYLTSVRKTTSTSVVLTWTKGWGPVNEYVIWYGTTKEAAMHTTAVIKGEEQVKTAIIAGLNPTTLYYFKLQPKNGCKSGPFSNTLASNERVITTGYTQGVSYSLNKPATKTNNKSTQVPVQPVAPKKPTVIEFINGFFRSIFK